jgi:hypothetical protein
MSVTNTSNYVVPRDAIREGDRIEALALPGEDRAEMRAELNRWFAFYKATSPITIGTIGRAYFHWSMLRRIRDCAAATRELQIHQAQFEWDDAQFAKVREHKWKLAHAPAVAVRELYGFAAGCRWMINRWQRLRGLIEKNGTLYGADRDEAIRLLGGVPAFDRLRESGAAWATWGCCLLAQPKPNRDEVVAYAATMGLQLPPTGAEPSKLSDPQRQARKWLRDRIEGELTRLRQREEWLWVNHEEPARTAKIEQALATVESKLGTIVSYERAQEKQLKQSLAAVARECKRTGEAVPCGVPYEPS